MKKHLLNAAFLCAAMTAIASEPVDVTPSGLKFDSYEKGAEFKVTASTGTGWSVPSNTFSTEAFANDGQQTVLVARGGVITQEDVDALQRGFTIREVGKAGKCLVITQIWSPSNNGVAEDNQWPAADMRQIAQPQFNFYLDPANIKTETDKVHYVRVRLLYTALFRGCHYKNENYEASRTLVKSIYATHDGGWVVPEKDNEVGDKYAEDAANFAKWVGETGKIEDIPATPEIYVPVEGDNEPWDVSHNGGIIADGHAAYLMNSERFRTYEFDVPVSMPRTISVQFNINNQLATYIIKEIKFTDLGTNEADATLLGKRKIGWTYFNEYTTGVEAVTAEDAADVPAVYYNLQGVEVKNPANGIYIVRRGNKVTKEIVR